MQPKPKYECCGFAYTSKEKYTIHRDKYHNDQLERLRNNQFLCKFCKNIFQSYQTILNHVNTKHTKDSKYMCNICSATYHSLVVLKRHIKKHTEPPKEILKVAFECPTCTREFSTLDSLDAHTLTSHTEHYDRLVDKRYQCKYCQKIVVAKISIEEHLNAVHFSDKSYLCGTCGKNCYSRLSLKKHELSHTTVKPFKCDQCCKAFKLKYALKKHQQSMHDSKTRFNCSGCSKSFANHNSLTKHIEMYHANFSIYTQEEAIEEDDSQIRIIEVVPKSMEYRSELFEGDEELSYEDAEELSNGDGEKESDNDTVTIYEFYN